MGDNDDDVARGHEPRFDLDLEVGRQSELWLRDVLETAKQRKGRIEVKRDRYYSKTKRLYVELQCRGRDGNWRASGLATTGSKIWAFVVCDSQIVIMVNVEVLRLAVELACRDPKNAEAKCDRGSNPTKGAYVYDNHIRAAAVEIINSGRLGRDRSDLDP